MAKLELKQINKKFGQVHVLHDIDLEIDDGEFVVFVGPSGCGKSTLLRSIAGLEDITSGELLINNELVNDKTPAERGIGMVFQSYALYPHMSVRDNMTFSLRLAGKSKAERNEVAERIGKILELDHLLDRKPKALSGGQRQRVAIGRAIAKEPQVFLFDEPLSNLDAKLRVQMRMEISKLHERLRSTMIYVTHDQVEAMTLADKIVVLNKGHIEQIGEPMELYHHPANLFVAGFIGSPKMNFIPCEVINVQENGYRVSTTTGYQFNVGGTLSPLEVGEQITVGVRPEHMSMNNPDGLMVNVQFVEELGNESLIYTELTGLDECLVARTDQPLLDKTKQVSLTFEADACYIFDSKGLNCSLRKSD
ncbi:sn-glycerol-3-phosphate ABC transporter ATP-binding protein UgpC [Vibrio sinensis]|uniref:sn-glycerol-3-phosphate ABC transporter ATP-binding protein UgpC n=1 Tax=Vibrio sinensis TaxID=2302434 RepID=A0A3A6R3F2_9VIBR|nr:sn-glycerol-3-phosphate ABC transporter ATP-binding protein UgpC [Vibrio sinensis]RJX75667.1 sn-glycerol-3-phosphate ABC transporter ATP-binding protein UgpC [Vibrio sinensis]